jgi:hypothetical protein
MQLNPCHAANEILGDRRGHAFCCRLAIDLLLHGDARYGCRCLVYANPQEMASHLLSEHDGSIAMDQYAIGQMPSGASGCRDKSGLGM